MKKQFLHQSLKIFTILILGFIPLLGKSQNKIWVTPPHYIQFQSGVPVTTPLPIPSNTPTNLRYNGQGVEFAANGMHDADGNLLFFVVDEKVYNGQGYFIGDITKAYGSIAHGITETAIIPVPGNCCQFYIVVFGDNPNGQHSVYYQRVDMCADNPNFPAPDDGITGALLEYQEDFEEYWSTEIYSFPGFIDDNRTSTRSIAVTKENNNNERYAFVYDQLVIARLKVTASGIFYDNYEEYITENDGLGYELELFENASGIKIALAIEDVSPNHYGFMIKDFDLLGVPTGTYTLVPFDILNFTQLPEIIKGVEFSPNGDYLYFNIANTLNPDRYYYIDIANATANLLSVVENDPNSTTYWDGFMETGSDGKLYYVRANGLGTLNSPNSPTTSTFTPNAVLFPTSLVSSDHNSFLTTGSHQRYFALPDQIDGENLTPFVDPSQNEQCCADLSVYREWIYSASSSSLTTWDYGVGNNPWNVTSGDILIEKELIIPSGRTLTIKNMTFRFAPDAKVTVEKNARLTMNNATFTSVVCPVLWKGIEVWGTPSVSHALANNVNYGYINVINNSEISNALNGITSCQRDNNNNYILTQSGGYVLATNSDFINNRVDVDLTPHLSGGFFPTQSNKSTFRGCRFTTAGLLNDQSLPENHVRMVQVSGVKFYNNTFQNTTPLLYPLVTTRGNGIYSVDSKFFVTYGCSSFQLPGNPCPEQNRIGNTFSHLYYGINASSASPLRNFVVEYSDFNEVHRGIRMVGMLFCKIDKNEFYIGEVNPNTNIPSYGIHQTNCSAYFLQNNHFEDANNANYGVVTVNSGAFNNLIRNNTFEDLEYGATAIQTNYGFDPNLPNNYTGLQYLCNDFTGSSEVDVQVPSGGISSLQGSCITSIDQDEENSAPANNTFSPVQPSMLHFTLDGNNLVQPSTYIFSNQNLTAFDIEPNNQSIYPNFKSSCSPAIFTSKAQVCVENINAMISNGQLLSRIALSKSEIAALIALIDGGNTQNLLNAIASQSNGQVKNTLMEASPYLSDEVLLAYLSTNPPAGHIKQIILANSPVSVEVMDYLNNMNLPNGIRNQINAGQTGESGMDVLRDDVSAVVWEKDMATDELLRRYLNDTINDQLDSMDIVLKANQNVESDAIRVAVKVYQGNFTDAATLINDIRLITNQYDDYLKLMESLIIIYQCQDKAYRLNWDMPLKQDVEAIANAGTEKIECKNAGSILELLKIFSQPEVFENVNPAYARSMFGEDLPSESKQYFTLYPNPTNNYLNIKLPVVLNDFSVEVYDITGKLIFSQTIIESDYALINAQNFNSGIYSIRIVTDNNSYTSLFVKE